MSTNVITLSVDFDLIGAGGALPDTDVRFADRTLYVDDAHGSLTYVSAIYSDTLLGIRRAVRELNPGRIPIDSPYDCTGKVCFKSCKLLKVYKTYCDGYVAIVEIGTTLDV